MAKTFTLYTASWCSPCKELKSWISDNYIDNTLFEFVDVDEEPDLAQKMDIIKLPTLIVHEEGSSLYQLLEGRELIKPYLEHFNATTRN